VLQSAASGAKKSEELSHEKTAGLSVSPSAVLFLLVPRLPADDMGKAQTVNGWSATPSVEAKGATPAQAGLQPRNHRKAGASVQ